MIEAGGIVATRRLEAFLGVVEHGSFSRAAERLGVTQPTVSQLVAALERSVGAPLLVRGRADVRPTAAGRALIPHAQALLAEAERAAAAVEAADLEARRHLRVSAGEALATYVLPPALARMRGRLPGLRATFVIGDEERVVSSLRSGEVDVAVMTDRTPARDLDARPFDEGRLALIAAPDDELARPGVRVTARDLAARTIVVRDPGTVNRREIDAMFREAGVRPRSLLAASSLEAVKRCVEAGLGVSVVPSIAIGREVAAGTLVDVPLDAPGATYRFVVCTRRDEAPPAPARALVEDLVGGVNQKGTVPF